MKFGFHKCAEIVLKKGKLVNLQNLVPYFNRQIKQLEQGKNLKHLRTEISEGVQHQQMVEKLKKKYTKN
jgi:hypothetical protein